jgi:uncharacterized protein YabN with tetrapyrrole methylase and pyrophosphatase domain
MTNRTSLKKKFAQLKAVYETLHGPNGCMWDKEQRIRSILEDLREEVDEFVEGGEEEDYENMKDEIGDILLHVMFHAQMAEENGKYTSEDVTTVRLAKIVRRHPLVFGRQRFLRPGNSSPIGIK